MFQIAELLMFISQVQNIITLFSMQASKMSGESDLVTECKDLEQHDKEEDSDDNDSEDLDTSAAADQDLASSSSVTDDSHCASTNPSLQALLVMKRPLHSCLAPKR